MIRVDMGDALAAVEWASANIAVMQNRFIQWTRLHPYRLYVEPDPQSADQEFVVACLERPLDGLIIAHVGAIINSLRSALDILMAAVLASNGHAPKRSPYFPICATEADVAKTVTKFEHDGWVTPSEAVAIKDARPYKGGSDIFYPLNQLDNCRKHVRLLKVEPKIQRAHIMTSLSHLEIIHETRGHKFVLCRLPIGQFSPTKSNIQISAQIFLDEPLAPKTPARDALAEFTRCVRSFIQSFPSG